MPVESDLSERERAEIGAMWTFRARGEHETAAQYADLARRLAADGVASETVSRVESASRDELRHRDLCAELAERAGCRLPPWSRRELPRIAPHDLKGRVRLCYEVVAFFCVTESINATLLLRSWQLARDEATRAALRALLADEVQHSRIGWSYLSNETSFKDEIAARLPLMLAAAVHDEKFLSDPAPPAPPAPSSPSESPTLAAHGLLSQSDRRKVFLQAMEDVVLPGLALCGVATNEARRWLAECTSRWP